MAGPPVALEAARGPTTVQTIIFDKSKFTVAQAKAWCKRNGMRSDKVDEPESGESIRMRQRDPGDFAADGMGQGAKFKTMRLAAGVQATVGVLSGDVGRRGGRARSEGEEGPMQWLDVLLEAAKGPACVQSLIFSTEKFNLEQALLWAKDHGFWGQKIEDPDDGSIIRLMQCGKDEFAEDGIGPGVTLKSIDFAPGVQAMIGVMKHDVGKDKMEKMPARTESESPEPADEPATLMEADDGRQRVGVCLRGDIVLESDEASERLFAETGMVRGWMPVIDQGADGMGVYTSNGNRYTRRCAENLERDVRNMLSSKSESTKDRLKIAAESGGQAAPWPFGVMYPSHEPARNRLRGESESVKDFREIAAEINGTRRAGRVTGVTFETIPTASGKDMAVLMRRGHVKSGSLRAIAQEQAPNDRKGYDVDRLRVETFGTDFTFRPAARDLPPLKLEDAPGGGQGATDGGDASMTLEELKQKHPELYAEIMAKIAKGESAEQALGATSAKLEVAEKARAADQSALREAAAKDAGKKYVDSWRDGKLKGDRAIGSAAKEKLVGMVLEDVRSAAAALASERADLDPSTDRFSDALAAKADPILKGRLEGFKAIIGGELKDRKLSPKPNMALVESAGEEMVAPNLNTMDGRLALIESENEMIGLPRMSVGGSEPRPAPIKDVIMSRIINPNGCAVYEVNDAGGYVHVIDKYLPGRRAIAARMLEAYENVPFFVHTGSPLNPNDRQLRADPRYEESRQLYQKIIRREKLEAGEMDTLTTLGALVSDIKAGIVEASIAMAKSMSMVTVQPCDSETYKIYEKNYERLGMHKFAELTVGGAVSFAADEGAVTTPERVKIKVDTAFDVQTVVTLDITDDKGDASTATATVKTTNVAGDVIDARPAVVGTYVKDVTSISFAAGASAGKVTAFVEDVLSGGTELAPSGKGRVWLSTISGTVDTYTLEAVFTWIMLENAVRALAIQGPGRFDATVQFANAVTRDWATEIDKRFFRLVHSATMHDASNDMTLDGGAGATKEDLHEYLFRLSEGIAWWGKEGKPTHLCISASDTNKLLWIKKDLIQFFERRAEEFFRAQSWGVVAGMEVVDFDFQYVNKMSAVNRSHLWFPTYIPFEIRGPFSYVSGQMTDTFVCRSRSTHVFTKEKTRGDLLIKGF